MSSDNYIVKLGTHRFTTSIALPVSENNKDAYIIEEETGNINYIIEPSPIDEDIGLLIRSLITYDSTNYLK